MSSPTASTHTPAAAKNLGGSQQRGEHDGQADDQARVGGAGVRDAVRLQQQDGRLSDPQHGAGADLVTAEGAEGAEGTAYECKTDERGYRVPREQDHQDREGVGGRLRREVAGTPDDRDKQKYQVGTAGMRHSPYGAGRRR
jgi:hypothetical protein